MTFILRTFGHSVVLGRGAAIDGYGGSLALTAVLLVCMPADVEASARGFYIFSWAVWVGGKGYRRLTILCGGTFGMHVKESGTSERCIRRFLSHRFIFKGLVRGDIAGPVTLTLSGGAYGAHARRSESTAHRRFYIAPLVVASFLQGDGGWRYRCRSILGSDAFGMHASRAEGQTREFSFFCACAVFV